MAKKYIPNLIERKNWQPFIRNLWRCGDLSEAINYLAESTIYGSVIFFFLLRGMPLLKSILRDLIECEYIHNVLSLFLNFFHPPPKNPL